MNEQTTLRQHKPSFFTQLSSYLLSHLQCFFATLGNFLNSPMATVMTSASLGIAIALPAGLYEVAQTVQKVGGNFNHIQQITLYLEQNLDHKKAQELQQQIQQQAGVLQVELKTRQQALEEFQQYSGFVDALKELKDNPLPHVLIVQPVLLEGEQNTQVIEQLMHRLENIPGVDEAQLDVQWLRRLFSMIDVLKTGVWIIAGLLSLAVLLIIGNTVRLAIENRRQEILVMKLIGATNSFIRRPFLYTGFLYGLLGGLLAMILVDSTLIIMNHSLDELRQLYQSDLLHLSTMGIQNHFQLIIISALLGLLGGLIAVNQQIKSIEPT